MVFQVKYISNKKFPGDNLISNLMLKQMSKKSFVELTHLFNAILRKKGYSPTYLKKVQIIITSSYQFTDSKLLER